MTIGTEGQLSELMSQYRDRDVSAHAVSWFPDRWRRPQGEPLHDHKALIDRLADETEPAVSGSAHRISRATVFNCRGGGPVDVFVASMIFGFGNRGYGPSRTNKMLATTSAVDKIVEADRILRTKGAKEAHRYLINRDGRLAWCRTPFITKFLYFDGFDNDTPGNNPLILDQFVVDRLAGFGHSFRLHFTDDYDAYLALAAKLAATNQLPRTDLVELALFNGPKAPTA